MFFRSSISRSLARLVFFLRNLLLVKILTSTVDLLFPVTSCLDLLSFQGPRCVTMEVYLLAKIRWFMINICFIVKNFSIKEIYLSISKNINSEINFFFRKSLGVSNQCILLQHYKHKQNM